MLILGVLAAIALPAFLGQEQKGQDADAKANARNLVSLVEACYTGKDDYTQCSSQANLGGNLGIPYGTNPGEANVADSTRDSFTVTATSTAKTGGANNTFSIARASSGVVSQQLQRRWRLPRRLVVNERRQAGGGEAGPITNDTRASQAKSRPAAQGPPPRGSSGGLATDQPTTVSDSSVARPSRGRPRRARAEAWRLINPRRSATRASPGRVAAGRAGLERRPGD